MKWQVKSQSVPTTLPELTKVLLENRGLSAEASFFSPAHPTQLNAEDVGIDVAQLTSAVERIQTAIAGNQRIVIFGDYDADGVCATAILWKTLKFMGANVTPFIPDREKHGYGLSERALDSIISPEPPDLLITVDNGIVAHSAVKYAQAAGIEVIVTDHHQRDDQESPALAVVHTTQLCGSSVAWMLCKALVGKGRATLDLLEDLLDLVAIATIADLVPLVGPNRSFAVAGLKQLKKSQRPGIIELCKVSNVVQSEINESTVGYILAPRINAAGRMGDPMEALRLLCTSSPVTASDKAQLLNQLNTDRQALTSQLCELAERQAQEQTAQSILIIELPEGVEGIIGLVAGKLTQQYNKPSLVVSKGESYRKGSARSVVGVHITEFMRLAGEHLASVGGHQLAGGFSVSNHNWETVKQVWQTAAREIDPSFLVPFTYAECAIDHQLLSMQTVESLQQLGPFGAGNPEPVFIIKNVKLGRWQTMGAEQQHLRVALISEDYQILEAIWWQGSQEQNRLTEDVSVLAIGKLGINRWKNRDKLQIILKYLE